MVVARHRGGRSRRGRGHALAPESGHGLRRGGRARQARSSPPTPRSPRRAARRSFSSMAHRSPRAVVLLHGFTDSPRQFADARRLAVRARRQRVRPAAATSRGARKDVGELARLTAAELCRTADDAVDIAAGLGDSVIVIGLSVGGTLAAWAARASRRGTPRRGDRAAVRSRAHVPSMLERPIVNLGSHVPNMTRRAAPDIDAAGPRSWIRDARAGAGAPARHGRASRRRASRVPARAEDAVPRQRQRRTVKTAPVLDLARVWNDRGVPVSVYEIPGFARPAAQHRRSDARPDATPSIRRSTPSPT